MQLTSQQSCYFNSDEISFQFWPFFRRPFVKRCWKNSSASAFQHLRALVCAQNHPLRPAAAAAAAAAAPAFAHVSVSATVSRQLIIYSTTEKLRKRVFKNCFAAKKIRNQREKNSHDENQVLPLRPAECQRQKRGTGASGRSQQQQQPCQRRRRLTTVFIFGLNQPTKPFHHCETT